MSTHHVLSLFVSLSLLTACGGGEPDRTWIDDDFPEGFELVPRVGEGLHSPYVLGTAIALQLQSTDRDVSPSGGLTLSSDDPAVIRIDSTDGRSVSATAIGLGATTLRVFGTSGEELASERVEVRAPTRVEIYPYAALTRNAEIGARMIEDATLRVVEGGGAVYIVRYFDGDIALSGSGVLQTRVTSDGGGAEGAPAVEMLDAFTFREWLFVTAGTAGRAADVMLGTGDLALGSVRVESVGRESITAITLFTDETGALEGDEVSVLARASDAEGQMVEGTTLAFELDGAAVSGEGDLFTYVLDRDRTSTLRASLPGSAIEATAMVHAAIGSGVTGSSVAPGCSVAHGARGGLAVIGAVLAMLALWVRRR